MVTRLPDAPDPAHSGTDLVSDPRAGLGLVPMPVSVERLGEGYALAAGSAIRAVGDASGVGEVLAGALRPSTGFAIPVGRTGDVTLDLVEDGALGGEGYRLAVTRDGVRIEAATPAGLFRATTTLRQLLPPGIECAGGQPGRPWPIPGVRITDRPRFAHRGAMLDVARHFFTVADVKRFVDLVSAYKVNVLHLHLSDDQGWRLAIDSWPRLATHGGSTAVGGGAGGFYTKAELTDIVRYAARRHVTVVPEIDTPGHTNAALASYPELNCDGAVQPLYIGIAVGFSSLCLRLEATYAFLADVFGELTELTPGPLVHIGGDEAHSTPRADYLRYIPRVAGIVNGLGKRVMGWQEIADCELPAGSVVQYWGTGDERSAQRARSAAEQGAQVVMSPANRAYLDMKYDPDSPYGQHWAGHVDVRDSYDWDPARQVPGVDEAAIAGVEATIWTETLQTMREVEFMAFPRLPGIAEIGWSSTAGRSWPEYRHRLAAHAVRWRAMDVNYHPSPDVPWSAAF